MFHHYMVIVQDYKLLDPAILHRLDSKDPKEDGLKLVRPVEAKDLNRLDCHIIFDNSRHHHS